MGKTLELPMKDEGEINFSTDFSTGQVSISIRPPLAIQKATVQVSITDFLEIAAKMTLESIANTRQLIARAANGQKA